MWFEPLTGFQEDSVDDVAAQFHVDGEHITSVANGRRMRAGSFATPSLGELRSRAAAVSGSGSGPLRVSEIVADVQDLHLEPTKEGAMFQVASQFNTLEMVSPTVTPEAGIDGYSGDRTQGPACAIACGAGTIYRNYLVPIDGQVGQSSARQINCLEDVASRLGADVGMRNGYALPDEDEIRGISDQLRAMDGLAVDALRSLLRIGLQRNTEVTLREAGYVVTQAYCSALPVAYSEHPAELWEPFARLVLEAAYEATLAAGVMNGAATGNRTVFLTLIGGGVFGNPTSWIIDAIERAARIHAEADLDVRIVSYGRSNAELRVLLR